MKAGIATANRFGFYLVEETYEGQIRWAIYDRTSGKSIALYWPATGKWYTVGRLGDHRGVNERFNDLFLKLRDLMAEAGM